MQAPSPYSISSAAQRLGALLQRCGCRIACAESCTGGGLAYAITEIPGSSGWFDMGVVTYSNAMKRALLGVAESTLNEHGAVSEAVVREMVQGAIRQSQADFGISTSGIAGPGGATEGKPVGTVCFGWGAANEIYTATERFQGNREQVRQQAILSALIRIQEYIETASCKGTV